MHELSEYNKLLVNSNYLLACILRLFQSKANIEDYYP